MLVGNSFSAVLADTDFFAVVEQLATESVGLSAVPNFLQGRIVFECAESVCCIFVETAGQHLSVGGYNRTAPETVTTVAESLSEMVMPVLRLVITRITLIGGHKRMTFCIIVELRRL